MSDPKQITADTKAPEITAAEAAKKVFRTVPEVGQDGQPTGKTKQLPVRADDLMAWSVKGDRLVVVTTDGQKLEGKA